MTESQYADLAAACDRLLRAPSTSLSRLAIPLLHFLNEHPSVLAQYASLSAERLEGQFSYFPRAAFRAARRLAGSLAVPEFVDTPQGPIDIVIVSHLLHSDQLYQENDFFFGALQSRLKEHGASSLLLLVSHLQASRTRKRTPTFASPRFVLPATASLATELSIWRQCAAAWLSLRRDATEAGKHANKQLAALASQEALSASTAMNLRTHAAIQKVCQSVKPKIVITTYEGAAIERIIWHAARTARQKPLCAGYQHAMVLERAHAIRRRVAVPDIDCDPDVILTLGEIPHAALAASPELQSVRLIEYGSHRRASLLSLTQPQHRPRRCLVLPDASFQECTILFNFALDCARRCADVSFILRPHPVVDAKLLVRRLPVLGNLPGNVSFSANKPLELEFSQSRYCLYRGSSAAMHAVGAGIKPYYLAQPGELDFDCLSVLDGWRETVTSPEQLLNRMRLADQSTDTAAANRAASICERYVSPVRSAGLSELLTMVGP